MKLQLRRTHPLSLTARLDFLSRHRTQPAADAVLLLADSCVLGPKPQSHVVCRDWTREVILFRQEEKLYCHAAGHFEIDGVACRNRGLLQANSRVSGEGFSFSLEPVERSSVIDRIKGRPNTRELENHVLTRHCRARPIGRYNRSCHACPATRRSPRGGGPFLYASGSRPLEGYTIKRGVGSGGFGEVYYAISDAGKEVALKLIRRNLDTELRGMRQCLNLKHPNLLSLYDIRQDDAGGTWVVMEYMSGKCLESEIADHPQGLPLDEAMDWFHGIAAGVAYLHDHGIVHRDLKPGNIFCDEGVVKVGDYGLSKFISCSRRSGHTESIGTVHYMAPEVAHGRYGKELDIYALGAVLYELLTGRVPFDGESVGEVLMKHLTAQPDVSKLAEPYRSVVARALEKDPARRFATVGEMAAALPGGAASRVPMAWRR